MVKGILIGLSIVALLLIGAAIGGQYVHGLRTLHCGEEADHKLLSKVQYPNMLICVYEVGSPYKSKRRKTL